MHLHLRRPPMSKPVDDLLDKASKLSAEQRATLIDALCQFDHPGEAEWENAWIRECEERLDAYERGDAQAKDFNVVMEDLRRKYRLA